MLPQGAGLTQGALGFRPTGPGRSSDPTQNLQPRTAEKANGGPPGVLSSGMGQAAADRLWGAEGLPRAP